MSDEITLREAATLARQDDQSAEGVRRLIEAHDATHPQAGAHSPGCGCESTLTLDAMLAASRRGKTIRY